VESIIWFTIGVSLTTMFWLLCSRRKTPSSPEEWHEEISKHFSGDIVVVLVQQDDDLHIISNVYPKKMLPTFLTEVRDCTLSSAALME